MMGELKMSKTTFRNVCSEYVTIRDEEDIFDAFMIVHDLLLAEADAITAHNPADKHYIDRLRRAAHEVIKMTDDVTDAYFRVICE